MEPIKAKKKLTKEEIQKLIDEKNVSHEIGIKYSSKKDIKK
jgi:hypothetical protein